MTQAVIRNPQVRRRVAKVIFSAPDRQPRQYVMQSRGYSTGTTGRQPRRMFRIGVELARFADFAKLDLRSFQPDNFHTNSTVGKHVWRTTTIDPLKDLEKFGLLAQEKPQTLLEFLKAAIAEANKLTDRNGLTEYVETQFGHQYVFISRGISIPDSMLDLLTDLTNPKPFLDMHTCFPPYGTLIPRGITEGSENRDQDAVISYVREFLATGKGPIGLGALGDSSTIEFSGYTAAQLENFFARYVWANTTGKHVFDGRVLWIQVIDPVTKLMYFIGIGAGNHRLSIMDGFNTIMGGVVFSLMIRRYGHALQLQSISSEPQVLVDGLGWDSPSRLAILDKIARDEPELVSTEAVISMLDFIGEIAAFFRSEVGPNVIGPPKSGAMIELGSDLGENTDKD